MREGFLFRARNQKFYPRNQRGKQFRASASPPRATLKASPCKTSSTMVCSAGSCGEFARIGSASGAIPGKSTGRQSISQESNSTKRRRGVFAPTTRLERILREIRRRTRVVGAFPDGQFALNLAAARLRHIARHGMVDQENLNIEL